MKYLLFFPLLIGAIQSSYVIELTDENFHEQTRTGNWILKFHAPWCQYCQQLEPILEEASVQIHRLYPSFKIGKIDCTKEKALAEEFKISGYPTLKLSINGKTSEYDGRRTVSDFLELARKGSGPTWTLIKDKKTLDVLSRRQQVSFLVHSDNTPFVEQFKNISRDLFLSVGFYVTEDPKLFKEIHGSRNEGLLWIGDKKNTYEGDYSPESVEEWILERDLPVFTTIDGYVWQKLMARKKKLVISAVNSSEKDHMEFNTIIKEIAHDNPGEFIYGWLDASEYSRFISRYISPSDLPHIFVVNPDTYSYYTNTTIPRNKEGITQYLDDISSGVVQPFEEGGMWNNIVFVSRQWLLYIYANPIYGVGMICALLIIFGLSIYLIFMNEQQQPPVGGESEKEGEEGKEKTMDEKKND